MSDLLQIKSWMSIEEAAQTISKAKNTQLTEKDIYQLVLERKLILSINFRTSVPAVLGDLEEYLIAPTFKSYPYNNKHNASKLLEKHMLEYGENLGVGVKFKPKIASSANVHRRLFTANQVTQIRNIWDLLLSNGAISLVEAHFHNYVSKTAAWWDEIYLFREDSIYASLVEPIEIDDSVKNTLADGNHTVLFVNQGKLTDQRDFVIRSAEIKRFLKSMTSTQEKPYSSRERNNQLRIIGVLLEVLTNSKGANIKQNAIIKLLHEWEYLDGTFEGLSESNLEKTFKKAKDVLFKNRKY